MSEGPYIGHNQIDYLEGTCHPRLPILLGLGQFHGYEGAHTLAENNNLIECMSMAAICCWVCWSRA